MMNEIPGHIKDKVEDKNWNEVFIFENMSCGHNQNSNDFEKLNCDHCTCIKRENWLEECLTKCSSNETFEKTDLKGNKTTQTLQKIIVKRGKLDDVIGISKVWN